MDAATEPRVTDLAARLVRAVDAFADGDIAFGVSIVEDLLDETLSTAADSCDACCGGLSHAEECDARTARRLGDAGLCTDCLHAYSVRAA